MNSRKAMVGRGWQDTVGTLRISVQWIEGALITGCRSLSSWLRRNLCNLDRERERLDTTKDGESYWSISDALSELKTISFSLYVRMTEDLGNRVFFVCLNYILLILHSPEFLLRESSWICPKILLQSLVHNSKTGREPKHLNKRILSE